MQLTGKLHLVIYLIGAGSGWHFKADSPELDLPLENYKEAVSLIPDYDHTKPTPDFPAKGVLLENGKVMVAEVDGTLVPKEGVEPSTCRV